jgi:hypothetical protein|tara:strand:+ start:4477 stop:4773 length:297 start_codon:yes stop_codon:yes gene_type:complete
MIKVSKKTRERKERRTDFYSIKFESYSQIPSCVAILQSEGGRTGEKIASKIIGRMRVDNHIVYDLTRAEAMFFGSLLTLQGDKARQIYGLHILNHFKN